MIVQKNFQEHRTQIVQKNFQEPKTQIVQKNFQEHITQNLGPNVKDVVDDEQSLSKSRRNGKEIRRIDDINVRSDKNQPKNIRNRNNVKVIKRSNKLIQALDLPTICNLNPRSVYNKIDEFHNFVKE